MKIEAVSLYKIKMPLIYPWKTAYGSDEAIESILVNLRSGEFSGWGEVSPLSAPTYSPEYCDGVFALEKRIAPLLPGKDIPSGEELQRMLKFIKGNPFAKSGFDMAWWDLAARMNHTPLWKYIGGVRRTVVGGADFGIQDSIGMLIDKVGKAVEAGYPRIKLKFGPGWDLDMLSAVRKAFPEQVFHIDCNSAYTLADLDLFKEVDKFGLAMIEQPLAHDDLIDHAELQKWIKTPICLDESLTSPEKAEKAIRIGAGKVFNLKPPRLGGLTPLLQVHDMAAAAGIPCWIGGMIETGLGLYTLLAAGSLSNITYPSDIFPAKLFFREGILKKELDHSACPYFELPDAPGSGAEIDMEKLRKNARDEFHL